jgi:hypothetical protein
VAALTATNAFATVVTGLPKTFDGKSPIAAVRSQSYAYVRESRGRVGYIYGLAVTIYVADASGTPQAVEDRLDSLVATTAVALSALAPSGDDSSISVGPSAPPDGQVLQVTADGVIYRAERIPVTWETEAV